MPAASLAVNGHSFTLDARPDRLDLRDLPYRPSVACLPPRFPLDNDIQGHLAAYVDARLILDQGQEGACTGYGLAATVNYLLWRRSGMTMKADERVSPSMLYNLARLYDEWPGEGYEGSSCRGALKGWHKHGVCREALWPSSMVKKSKHGTKANGEAAPRDPGEQKSPVRYDPGTPLAINDLTDVVIDEWDKDAVTRPLGVYYRIEPKSVVDMQAAIHEAGAIYVSCNVHAGWSLKAQAVPDSHDGLQVIGEYKKISGTHAFALVGYNERGFVVQNSWGARWGASGFAILRYVDWVDNGLDAWVVGLGVPVSKEVQGRQRGDLALTSPKHFIRTPTDIDPRAGLPGWLGGSEPMANNPDIWSEGEAYPHTLVAGNDGVLINRLVEMPTAIASAAFICRALPYKCFSTTPLFQAAPPRIVIYAHGGLNDEEESITRVRAMGPDFTKNGIYPIFLAWKSGWAETLKDMLTDVTQKQLGATAPARGLGKMLNEAWDRTVELLARGLLAKGMWTEMKENVMRGEDDGRDLSVLADHLVGLQQDLGGKLEIHLVGHSAGSFVCGRLLKKLYALNAAPNRTYHHTVTVKSCTLYAPACDLSFALEHYKQPKSGPDPHLVLDPKALYLHVLSDERELDDTVGPYTKSLLYLVSRALERMHKTPLLGMANAFDAARATDEYWHPGLLDSVHEWQAFFQTNVPPGNLKIYSEKQMDTGPCKIKATHGSFDNSIAVLEMTLRTILGADVLAYPPTNLNY